MNASPPQSTANVKTSTQPEHRLMLFKMPSFGSSLASSAKSQNQILLKCTVQFCSINQIMQININCPKRIESRVVEGSLNSHVKTKIILLLSGKSGQNLNLVDVTLNYISLLMISDFLAFTSIILEPPLHLSQFVRTEFTKITSTVTANQVSIQYLFFSHHTILW